LPGVWLKVVERGSGPRLAVRSGDGGEGGSACWALSRSLRNPNGSGDGRRGRAMELVAHPGVRLGVRLGVLLGV